MNAHELRSLIESLDLPAATARMEMEAAALPADENPRRGDGPLQVYARSVTVLDGAVALMVRDAEATTHETRRRLVLVAATPPAAGPVAEAVGTMEPQLVPGADGSPWIAVAPCTTANARALHRLIPWTRPVSLRSRRTTIGMGDRLGLATAGHIRAARRFAVAPVLAQQSVRENDFIGRSFDDVVANASWLVLQEGYRDGFGADGDHLKTIPAIDIALAAGMPMITLDLTEVMRPEVADWSDADVEAALTDLPAEFRHRVETEYADRTFVFDGTEVRIDAAEARRCAVMYGPALAFSAQVNDHLHGATDGAYDLEISIDETTTPTLPSHHLFIARELQVRGVTVNSLAPRFIGEFQKAIDYRGDLDEFDRQFRVHCLIAREFGGYKISVHSGSDKFAVYPTVGRETGMRLHLKTSGTSWLEALRVIARTEPALYRRIHRFVEGYYPTALNFYHIDADFAAIPALDGVADADLSTFLDDTNARQMLHISYGGVLQDPALRRDLYAALHRHEDAHAAAIAQHFERHIRLLGAERV